MRSKTPITLVWAQFRESRKLPVVLDEYCQVHEPATRFLIYKANAHIKTKACTPENYVAYQSTVHDACYSMREFIQFIADIGVSWDIVKDSHLLAFKMHCQRVISLKASARSSQTAMLTANRKLILVYEFYWWAQSEAGLISDRVGSAPQSAIRSSICLHKNYGSGSRNEGKRRNLYPLLERGVAARNRHRQQHYSEDSELLEMKKNFRNEHLFEVAERNVLIVDLFASSGWRRGSLQSLRIDQFDEVKIKKALAEGKVEYPIAPDSQKFGYKNERRLPLQMVLRVLNYIKKGRSRILSLRGMDEETAKKHLFISYTTCKPLKAATITNMISTGFSELNIEKGAGPHSIRRQFGTDKSAEIIEARRSAGMSLDPTDVALDLADLLGQTTLAAQRAYSAGKKTIHSASTEARLRNERDKERAENDVLRLRLHNAERQLAAQLKVPT